MKPGCGIAIASGSNGRIGHSQNRPKEDLNFAREILLPESRQRPWRERLLERGASAVAGLL